ncbi:MAG: DNA/RNA-binding domain of Phe-tRNA-synthetase-like protein [Saprospiraceae bacterium]|jgi:DNA/RNA-binding domain of Phe-tRNA-synthetase-like protein
MTLTFQIDENIKNILPNCRIGVVFSEVFLEDSSLELLSKIENVESKFKEKLILFTESKLEVIDETRKAYKICGKEPSRYRPSAEALLKRVRQGKGLHKINNIVDAINLLSMTSQFSIGGFDVSKIEGAVALDIGNAKTYDAIGRGELNIEFMPGVRDDKGFFGTPTSDSVRTMVTSDIDNLVLVYYDFFGNSNLQTALHSANEFLKKYCEGRNIETKIID